MNECISLGLRQCKGCKYAAEYNAYWNGKNSICWIDVYSEDIRKISYKEGKLKFIEIYKLNNKRAKDPDWPYFFGHALINVYPEKSYILEKLMVLI